ncbi:MAG: ATP-dependent DNA helicase DinG [Bradymonadia bacterium]|jgi:ATP-dependent DNA helicase DinG
MSETETKPRRPKKPLKQVAAEVFGEEGSLARFLTEYEPRSQQVEMVEAVAEAFEDGKHMLIEAATGTGKTLAYLVPAVLSGKRTIVSTATKNLQEQILNKDIPLLHQVLDKGFHAVVLKGRQNYLCKYKYEGFRHDPKFRKKEDVHYWPAVLKWAARTDTGDRGEIGEMPDDWGSWSDLSMSSDACMGSECSLFNECYVTLARREAQDADVVVVNHHLFFADLALRQIADASLLPAYQAVIFDEAHNLEETASSYFGMQVSSYRYNDLLSDLVRTLQREGGLSIEIKAFQKAAQDRARTFFATLGDAMQGNDGRQESAPILDGPMKKEITDDHRALERRMLELHVSVKSANVGEAGTKLADRIQSLVRETAMLIDQDAKDMVYVIEKRGRGTFLGAFPIDLGPVFRDLLYSSCSTQIFTSATLTTDSDFKFFRSRLGMPKKVQTLKLEPVFDYMKQALLYVPNDLPDPTDREFIQKVAPTMQRLVELCDGRAFLLFTSYRNMNEAFRILGPKLSQPLLKQGDMSRAALLDKFRKDPRSVLFATSSFWEGVDVQGEALSLVVIDKLPFASPGDPLLKAKLKHLEDEGGHGFADYQVPAAAITLKQGFGRLIRHRNDSGIIAILDGRLLRRGYGKRFLSSLPRARRSQDFETVERWWRARSESD